MIGSLFKLEVCRIRQQNCNRTKNSRFSEVSARCDVQLPPTSQPCTMGVMAVLTAKLVPKILRYVLQGSRDMFGQIRAWLKRDSLLSFERTQINQDAYYYFSIIGILASIQYFLNKSHHFYTHVYRCLNFTRNKATSPMIWSGLV